MVFVACLLLVLAAGCSYQAWRHGRYLATIPLRIHVNGIRGKSSVTRLIAAGLRSGGIRTIAKTTGTKPRFIYDDGTEVAVARVGQPNIIEQVRIVRRAAQMGAQALVVECMAIKPELQSLLEDRMIRSTHSVITNVRADHLDQIGPSLQDVAKNLARTISRKGSCFTAEREHFDILSEIAIERETVMNATLTQSVDVSMLDRFSHVEHAENVALALAVCSSLGVDCHAALAGMLKAAPDPGALRLYRVLDEGREIIFINGFAVNDPDSYVLVWNRLGSRLPIERRVVCLAVCRADRVERSYQLGEMMAKRLQFDVCIAAGAETGPLRRQFHRSSESGRTVIDMEGAGAKTIYTSLLAYAGPIPLVIFGVGNIVGLGEEIVLQFSHRAKEAPIV